MFKHASISSRQTSKSRGHAQISRGHAQISRGHAQISRMKLPDSNIEILSKGHAIIEDNTYIGPKHPNVCKSSWKNIIGNLDI